MELGLYCLGRHIYYTFDPCLTQRICAGLLLSGVIALNPLWSAHIASFWQEHLVTHKPAKAPELWQSCSGRFIYSTSKPQRAAQVGRQALLWGATTCWVRRAELASLGAFSKGLHCRSLGLHCAGEKGLESGRQQGEKPREGIWWELDCDRYSRSSQFLDEESESVLHQCYVPCYHYGIGYLRGPQCRSTFSSNHGPRKGSSLDKGWTSTSPAFISLFDLLFQTKIFPISFPLTAVSSGVDVAWHLNINLHKQLLTSVHVRSYHTRANSLSVEHPRYSEPCWSLYRSRLATKGLLSFLPPSFSDQQSKLLHHFSPHEKLPCPVQNKAWSLCWESMLTITFVLSNKKHMKKAVIKKNIKTHTRLVKWFKSS